MTPAGIEPRSAVYKASMILVNRAEPISVSLDSGPHICASKVNATVGDRLSGSTHALPETLNANQGKSM